MSVASPPAEQPERRACEVINKKLLRQWLLQAKENFPLKGNYDVNKWPKR